MVISQYCRKIWVNSAAKTNPMNPLGKPVKYKQEVDGNHFSFPPNTACTISLCFPMPLSKHKDLQSPSPTPPITLALPWQYCICMCHRDLSALSVKGLSGSG